MSKMLRLELVGLVLLACTQILTEHRNFPGYRRYEDPNEELTRDVSVKEGLLRGRVLQPRTNLNLQPVDVFLGVPYAEPPVGSLRFIPPRQPQPWKGVRQSKEFSPVCPQVLPNLKDEVKPGRYEYLEKHLQYLRNQSEDCLYLNIYAPHQEGHRVARRYPVMVFIHGESFEWNSGNPYDGTILAAYGNVIFVTINFRLGILGFLRPGTKDDTASNFGLLDQIAALVWLKENIAQFGGDPNNFTLMGHGTGAIFANLLLISPVANNKGLFKRAILMSGSALSADAIGKAPMQITKQVAYALHCPTDTDSDLAFCLRFQDVEALLSRHNVPLDKPKYVPAFAPLIDKAVIQDSPLVLMQNSQIFGRFDLMYGVTESERFHLLPPLALLYGLQDNQRDQILKEHAKATHVLEENLILSKILAYYSDFSNGFSNDYLVKNRDMVLEVLSDSGTVAPLVMMANLHSKANPSSYMYVFSHRKAMQDYSGQQRQQTIHGEELPYVLGVPLDRGKYNSRGRYNIDEILFSEAMMDWWCNFAYTGNPNAFSKSPYETSETDKRKQYEIVWPEYDPQRQMYLNLTIPPNVGARYRAAEMKFWNEDLPNALRYPKVKPLHGRPKGPRPGFLDEFDKISSSGFTVQSPNTVTQTTASNRETKPFFNFAKPDQPMNPDTSGGNIDSGIVTGSSNTSNSQESTTLKSSSVITMMIGFGTVFLLINLTVFLYLYRKRHVAKKTEKPLKRRLSQKEESSKKAKPDKQDNQYGDLCYKSDSKPDLNEVIKSDKAYDNNSNFGRRSKLSRQNSSSTIDTHIKVREWIQQEIVHRCSPRFLRKTRETLAKEHQAKLTKQQEEEKCRLEQETLKEKQDEPIYQESPTLVVRPGRKPKLPKVSVGVDATTRTESVLNQVPIELLKNADCPVEKTEGCNDCPVVNAEQFQTTPQVVVIEHHHSRSDPLPMEDVFKAVKPNYSTPRIYESDSESAASLYAKINPKLKSRLPCDRFNTDELMNNSDEAIIDEGETYGMSGTTLTTFAAVKPSCDVNVTCREPTVERECVSPEEALRTIKRRNYPKVLPDIEKRRSLPVPTTLFLQKQHANHPTSHRSPTSGQAPLPPPRMFGPSKSLEFAEENESQSDEQPVTSNLHVGPLMRRQNTSAKNNSDPSIIDSCEGSGSGSMVTSVQSGGSVDTIYANPRCPVHGAQYLYSNCRSGANDIGNPTGNFIATGMGNPNWYKPASSGGRAQPVITLTSSEPRIDYNKDRSKELTKEQGKQLQSNADWERTSPAEPKIVITPRVGHFLGHFQERPNQTSAPTESEQLQLVGSCERFEAESSGSTLTTTSTGTTSATTRDQKNMGSLKHPKIIIKPTMGVQKTRDQRNIPKVSAIPSPATCPATEKDSRSTATAAAGEKPPLREKPKVTRIPSFSRRKDESTSTTESTPTYLEKTEIVQRIEAVPGKITGQSHHSPEVKSSAIPTLQRKDAEKSSSADSPVGTGNLAGLTTAPTMATTTAATTATVKRKPSSKK